MLLGGWAGRGPSPSDRLQGAQVPSGVEPLLLSDP